MNMIKLNDGSYYHCFLKDNATSISEEDNNFVFERINAGNDRKFKTIPIIAECKNGLLYEIITGNKIYYVKREDDLSYKTPGKSLISYCVREVKNTFVANTLKSLDEKDIEDYIDALKQTAMMSYKRYEEEIAKMKEQEDSAEEYIKNFKSLRKNYTIE